MVTAVWKLGDALKKVEGNVANTDFTACKNPFLSNLMRYRALLRSSGMTLHWKAILNYLGQLSRRNIGIFNLLDFMQTMVQLFS